MMKYILSCIVLITLLASCGGDKNESKNPMATYFYEVDSVPRIYLYRDIAHGLDEQFHRIYAVSDAKGDHIIVEVYATDGRILEAINYNVDSLDVMEVFKDKLIPMNDQEEVWFATRFQGFLDSTLILKEIKRKVSGKEIQHDVLGEKVPTIVMKDRIRMTNFNPFTKKESVLEGKSTNYFAKGYGLVEWHTPDKKVHYKLEKILTEKEFLQIITH
jgi:hypothetical protein